MAAVQGTQFKNRPLNEQVKIINRIWTNGQAQGMVREVRYKLLNIVLEQAGWKRDAGYMNGRDMITLDPNDIPIVVNGKNAAQYLRDAGVVGDFPRAIGDAEDIAAELAQRSIAV